MHRGRVRLDRHGRSGLHVRRCRHRRRLRGSCSGGNDREHGRGGHLHLVRVEEDHPTPHHCRMALPSGDVAVGFRPGCSGGRRRTLLQQRGKPRGRYVREGSHGVAVGRCWAGRRGRARPAHRLHVLQNLSSICWARSTHEGRWRSKLTILTYPPSFPDKI